MRKLTLALVSAAVYAGICAAQPVVSSALNAASYALPELPGSGIARGSMFVVFGQRLGPANLNLINNFPLPTTLDGTSIKVTVLGTTVDTLMIYTSATQVAAILPSNTPEGNGTLTLTYNGQTSAPFNIRVVRSAFGTFAVNQAGSGPGIVQNVNSEADRPVNALNRPARAGQVMILWGTGLGPVTADERAGAVPGDLPVNVEVYVGGRRANVTYKGRSGCCAGIDQIVFTVPEGVEGCYVPVVVKIDNAVSNFTSMSIGRGNTCTDQFGFSGTDIERAQTTGIFRVGSVSLSRTATKVSIPGFGTAETKNDIGAAGFIRYDLSRLLQSQGPQSGVGSTSVGACTVYSFRGTSAGTVDPIRPDILNAGPAINVTGPRGPKSLPRDAASGFYSGQLGGGGFSIPGLPSTGGQPDYLEPGSYTVTNGTGGPDVGGFSTTFNLAGVLTWTNIDSVSNVARANGATVTWTGGDPNGYVYISGTSVGANNTSGGFVCIERTGAGSFTIPSYVTLTLPQSAGEAGGILTVSGIQVIPITPAPSGLDSANVTILSGSNKSVIFQ